MFARGSGSLAMLNLRGARMLQRWMALGFDSGNICFVSLARYRYLRGRDSFASRSLQAKYVFFLVREACAVHEACSYENAMLKRERILRLQDFNRRLKRPLRLVRKFEIARSNSNCSFFGATLNDFFPQLSFLLSSVGERCLYCHFRDANFWRFHRIHLSSWFEHLSEFSWENSVSS